MVQIILARNQHTGREQAERLESLIVRADVLSLETANLPRTEGITLEQWFTDSRKHQQVMGLLKKMAADDASADYECALYEIIARYTKPVVLAEKLSSAEIKESNSLNSLGTTINGNAVKAFLKGRFDTAVQLRINAFEYLKLSAEVRNRSIIAYAPLAVQKARERTRQDCTYLIILGSKHSIASDLARSTGIAVEDVLLPATPYSHLEPRHGVWDHLQQGDKDSEELKLLSAQALVAHFFQQSLVSESLALFSDQVIPPSLQEAPYQLFICFDMYVVRPIAANLARQLDIRQIQGYSKLLAKRGYSLNDMDALRNITEEFLRTQGFDLPQSVEESEKWRSLFPFGQEQSTTPITTIYHPNP